MDAAQGTWGLGLGVSLPGTDVDAAQPPATTAQRQAHWAHPHPRDTKNASQAMPSPVRAGVRWAGYRVLPAAWMA